jgi:hypothetical protein
VLRRLLRRRERRGTGLLIHQSAVWPAAVGKRMSRSGERHKVASANGSDAPTPVISTSFSEPVWARHPSRKNRKRSNRPALAVASRRSRGTRKRIRRHGLGFGHAAMRTDNDGFKDHGFGTLYLDASFVRRDYA